MTGQNENGVSRDKNLSPGRFLSIFGIGKITSTLPVDIVLRSFREDFPIWIGSMWILWKQQSKQSTQIRSDKLSSTNELTTVVGAPTNIWQSGTLSMLIDTAVLGILLIYKKHCDEKYRKLFNRDDKHNDGEGKKREDSRIMPATRKTSNKMTDAKSVDELRGLLKKHSLDSSQLLSPKMRSAMGLPPVDSDLNPTSRHQPSLGTIESPSTLQLAEKNSNQKRYIELLVHNVSHTDLVLSLDAPMVPPFSTPDSSVNKRDGIDSYCLCRPRFSAFDAYSQRLVDFFKHNKQQKSAEALIKFPRYERNDETQQPESSTGEEIPIGFRLRHENNDDKTHSLHISSADLKDLRVRGRDAQRVLKHPDSLKINAVFFPLLATLMPLWMAKLSNKYKNFSSPTPSTITNPKKVLILVSGVGQPRNWTHSMKGNSTQQCAELMKSFLQTLYPELVVVHIHSETNIFRYDENINFVQNELLPRIQEYRDAHAKGLPYPDEIVNLPPDQNNPHDKNRPFSTEWRKSFSITLSYADGSPARNHAIQAALRTFRPMYYHFWQLKTFWHESKIVSSDIEVHSFEEMETLPPVETNQLYGRPLVKMVVDEMKKFKDDFAQILSNTSEGSDDIRAFWLRKTLKPVIAVLAVQTPNGKVKLYRGTNMEVSMPTGSLCAERNVIGTALADNPSLKREDLKMIAVLAIPNPKQTESSSKNFARQRVQSMNSIVSMVTATSEDELGIAKPTFIPSRKSSLGEEEDWTIHTPSSMVVQNPVPIIDKKIESNHNVDSSQPPSPARMIYLYNKPHQQTRKQKRAVIVHSDADINPLRPCGACNEWLKKLAESNPYFTILTFTDSACNGVYLTPCEE